ncbi:MAG: AMP-binding protein, partial [bacterium]|nr:AMP-binding protein [bacterium]
MDRYVYGDRGEIVLGIPLTVRGTGTGKEEASPAGIKGVTIQIDTGKSFNKLFRQVGEQVSAAKLYAPGVELPFATAVLMESIHDKDSIQGAKLNMLFSFRIGGKNKGKQKGHIHTAVEYDSALYKKTTIETIYGHFLNLLQSALSAGDAPLSALEILSQEEKTQLLYNFNNTARDYPEKKTIHGLFEEQVTRRPDSIAVFGSSLRLRQHLPHEAANLHLTYRELNKNANQLAGLLKSKGVGKNYIVPIILERTVEMILAMLGILKAGGAYLPVDSQYPAARKRFILKDISAKLLLTQQSLIAPNKEVFKQFPPESIVTVEDKDIYTRHDSNIQHINTPDDLAYIIYTSGTTGKPKGVMVMHRGIPSLNTYFKDKFNVVENDRIVQFASSSFDASVWEIYMALLNGAALYLVTGHEIQEHKSFSDYLKRCRITIATLPSIYVNNLEPRELNTLRILITAGSVANSDMVKKWSKTLAYINAYGPTETTI